MRTSRIARETAKVTQILPPSRKRQTRSSIAAHSTSSDNLLEQGDDTSCLSPSQSEQSTQISKKGFGNGKRGRGAERDITQSGNTTVASVSVTTRKSPRKKTVRIEEDVDIEEAGVPKPKKARRQPAKQGVDASTGEVVIHSPPNWEEVYKATQEMRRLVRAPVDTMGCENAGDEAGSPKVRLSWYSFDMACRRSPL